MSTIVAPLDGELGHTLALLGLLKLLRDQGRRVCCLGSRLDQDAIRSESIEFIPLHAPQRNPGDNLWPLLHGGLDEIVTQLNPNLFLLNSFYCTESLVIHCRCGMVAHKIICWPEKALNAPYSFSFEYLKKQMAGATSH
jgi:hypothetical protein